MLSSWRCCRKTELQLHLPFQLQVCLKCIWDVYSTAKSNRVQHNEMQCSSVKVSAIWYISLKCTNKCFTKHNSLVQCSCRGTWLSTCTAQDDPNCRLWCSVGIILLLPLCFKIGFEPSWSIPDFFGLIHGFGSRTNLVSTVVKIGSGGNWYFELLQT